MLVLVKDVTLILTHKSLTDKRLSCITPKSTSTRYEVSSVGLRAPFNFRSTASSEYILKVKSYKNKPYWNRKERHGSEAGKGLCQGLIISSTGAKMFFCQQKSEDIGVGNPVSSTTLLSVSLFAYFDLIETFYSPYRANSLTFPERLLPNWVFFVKWILMK